MKCPSCNTEYVQGQKFCSSCGARILFICAQCRSENISGDKLCRQCGSVLRETGDQEEHAVVQGGERKPVTVLFSDLSGYTSMSERLDPEEIRLIMNRILGRVTKIVTKYEGYIDRLIGDAIMVIFGIPKIHEDDPIRAIRSTLEIHSAVEELSPQFRKRIVRPLSMHTGINTGVVVTGGVNLQNASYEVLGDTINVASRLSDIAEAGEILIGKETFQQAKQYFNIEFQTPVTIEGKIEPVHVYKVISIIEKPVTIHSHTGLRSRLIGRGREMSCFLEAIDQLRHDKGMILSVCGEAGTGKSRLVEEFKTASISEGLIWKEGHSFAYFQNIPYFALMNFLSAAWNIEEGDSLDKVKEKIESHIKTIHAAKHAVLPFIGSLYGLNYVEVENISPELWKNRLFESVKTLLKAFTRYGPTVMCFEDFHWADSSSVEMMRQIITEQTYPVLFLFVYRPEFSLFTAQHQLKLGEEYKEIELKDLTPPDALEMVRSMLNTQAIPLSLEKLVQEKVEGNPFYLEEVLNSLINSMILIRDNGNWSLTRDISESGIPLTVQGVISARLDQLDPGVKTILKEASVIGRLFYYEIHAKITKLRDELDSSLLKLESLDLIKKRSVGSELEYNFKHALTQEAAYNSLLKKERQEIHEKIAQVMEQLFHDRLSEYCETIAFHFKQGKSLYKAVDYLMKSGEKNLKRYAVEESHQYYQDAFELLNTKTDLTVRDQKLLIDILIQWAFVFHYRGDFKGLSQLCNTYEKMAQDIGDSARLGMFYTLLGLALFQTERVKDAYQCLNNALKIGEDIDNPRIIGYACSWLSWVCPELGRFEEGVRYGVRSRDISGLLKTEDYLYFSSLGGIGLAYYFSGNVKKSFDTGKTLLDYGHENGNIRSLVLGYFIQGCSYLADGDFSRAMTSLKTSVEVSVDPWYSQFPRLLLGLSCLAEECFDEAKEALHEVLDYSNRFETHIIGGIARMLLAALSVADGNLRHGFRTYEALQEENLAKGRIYVYTAGEQILARMYQRIGEGGAPITFTLLKNIAFIIRNVPLAAGKAEKHFHNAIVTAEKIGAKAIQGSALLDRGILYKTKGKTEKARKDLLKAVQILEQNGSQTFLRRAQEALAALGQ